MEDTVRYIVTLTVKRSSGYLAGSTDTYVREVAGKDLKPLEAIKRVFGRLSDEHEEDFYLYDEVDVSLRRTR